MIECLEGFFFSFHYERDAWRAEQVRNSWVTKEDREAAGFWDAAEREEVQRQGEKAVKRWIDRQMEGTSVTVVLVGTETLDRKYVIYEIQRSIMQNKGIVFVQIHNQKDQHGKTDKPGDVDSLEIDGQKPSEIYPVYDWVSDDGYDKLGDWIDRAALVAGRPPLEPPGPRSAKPSNCIRP